MNPQLQAAFDQSLAGVPDWVAALRREGLDRYAEQAMPTQKMEHWKYVDLDFDLDDLAFAMEPGTPLPAGPYVDALGSVAATATVVDGIVVGIDGELGAGASIVSFRDATDADAALLQETMGRHIDLGRDKFAAAHRAFAGDGVLIHVGRSTTLDGPILVDVQATSDAIASFPHLTIVLAENAEASVVVNYRSNDDLTHVAVPQVEAIVGDGSRLSLISLQHWGRGTTAAVHEKVILGRDATGTIGEVGVGGKLARLDLAIEHIGNGSSSELIGLSFGDQTQTHDYRVIVRHEGKNTSSDVFLKGAVEDEASSVFTGLLRIEEDATRTSAFETNRNLVLSESASAQSVPNLEILCNDVICGHGSTVGQLEEEHLYYLMSRGLPKDRAERVLVRGFFEEVIDRLPVPEVADPVRAVVHDKFATAQAEGRIG
ncbi:MAG: Fe-S cluster assembly protein SufD [Acidimicrobiia bacterium]|nr:MAG: Fe-S cluster assembly protein SufD [Acidimicrobiia bacterium]